MDAAASDQVCLAIVTATGVVDLAEQVVGLGGRHRVWEPLAPCA